MAETDTIVEGQESSIGPKHKRSKAESSPDVVRSKNGNVSVKDGYTYKWNQNAKFVLVEINFHDSLVQSVNIGVSSVTLTFKGGCSELKLYLSNTVDISSSQVTNDETRVFLKLAKHIVNRIWPSLEKPLSSATNGCVTSEIKKNGHPTEDLKELLHLKHDWFEKGDVIHVHVYIKSVIEEQLSITFGEDFIVVEFSTRNEDFIKSYPSSTQNTIFRWQIKLKNKIDVEKSSFDIKKAFVNIQLHKFDSGRWGALEAPNFPARATLTQNCAATQKAKTVKSQKKTVPSNHLQVNTGTEKNSDSSTVGSKVTSVKNNQEQNKTTANGENVTACSTNNENKDISSEKKSVETRTGNNQSSDRENNGLNFEQSTLVLNSSRTEKESPQIQTSCKQNGITFSHAARIPDSGIQNGNNIACEASLVDNFSIAHDNESCPGTVSENEEETDTRKKEHEVSAEIFHISSHKHNDASKTNIKNVIEEPLGTETVIEDEKPALVNESEALYTATSQADTSQADNACNNDKDLDAHKGASSTCQEENDSLNSIANLHAESGPNDSVDNTLGPSEKVQGSSAGSAQVEEALGKDTPLVTTRHEEHKVAKIRNGLTGMENIGNTCYLNATLQCLVNTPELKEYFEGDFFKKEINSSNPLGLGGKLALCFASLVKKLWLGSESYLAPSKLRTVFAEKNTQFKNFLQHDSQEFLSFLLDGLHEDLNRIVKKPYIEHTEKPGRLDEEVACEAWDIHKARNDSVIVDQFQGQLKSKLTCPDCGKVSITFDPFMFLSVPLPKQQILLSVFVILKDPENKPLKMVLRVPKDPTVSQVLDSVARKLGLYAEDLRMFETYKSKIHKGFKQTDLLTNISLSDVFIVNEVWSEEDTEEEVLEVAFIQRLLYPLTVRQCSYCRQPFDGVDLKRCTKCLCVGYCSHACQKNHWSTHRNACKPSPQPVGVPFIISLPSSQATYSRLCELVEEFASYSVKVTQAITQTTEDSTSSPATPDEPSSLQNSLCTSATSLNGSVDSLNSGVSPAPKFYFKPVNIYGQSIMGAAGERLKDLGDESLSEQLEGRLFSIDWRNNPMMKDYVNIESKSLDCEEHESCQTECLPTYDHCTLLDCIELFTEPETLAPQEAWYCPECKEHREATKQMSLWRLPPVLIVHLKRFSFRNVLYRDKLNKFVDFPLRNLDMSPFVAGNRESQSTDYDLFGVVNHSGSVNFGHYTSYARLPGQRMTLNGLAKNPIGWRFFDDRRVSPVSEDSVKTKNAYVLFYRRRDLEQPPENPSSVPLEDS